MKDRNAKYVAIVGLSLVSVVGVAVLTSPYWLWYFRPSYQLGSKDELLSDLREYLGREDETAVQITNEKQDRQSYQYDLISKDQKVHGNLGFSEEDGGITGFGVEWRHNNDTVLQESGDLLLSAIADTMIPDWQKEDGQPYRNAEILKITKAQPLGEYYDNFHLEQDRYLRYVKVENGYDISVFIEPAL